jgi:hypothetical protein
MAHRGRLRSLLLQSNKFVTLPLNLNTTQPTVAEPFESTTGWSTSGNLVLSLNTTAGQFSQGSASLKMQSTDGAYAQTIKQLATPLDVTNFQKCSIDVYVPNVAGYSARFSFYGNAGGTKKLVCTFSSFSSFLSGLCRIYMYKADFAATSMLWTDPVTHLRIDFDPPNANDVMSWDNLQMGAAGIPAVMIRFDDGFDTQYTQGFTYMKPRGIPGTVYLQTDFLDDAGNLTTAQVLEMYNKGWTIGNHTRDGTTLSGKSVAAQRTIVKNGHDDLVSFGMPKGVNYFCFPSGSYDSNSAAALLAEGVLAAQNGGAGRNLCMPNIDLYHVEAYGTGSQTLATLTGYVDTAILNKTPLCLTTHKIKVDPGASDTTIVIFQGLIDYIYAKAKLKQIYPISFHDFYRLTQGSARVAKII